MLIVFCLPGNNFSSKFLISWSNLLSNCHQRGISIALAPGVDSHVAFARAKTFGYDVTKGEKQAPFQGKINYDYIMCIDSDIVFTPESFFKLLETPYDVTSGLYIMGDNRHYTVVKNWDTDYFSRNATFEFETPESIENYKQTTSNRYMPVTYSGLGWTLIKKGALEKVSYPPFWRPLSRIPSVSGGPDLVDHSSEDVGLFLNFRDAGINCYVDTSIRVGHEKPCVL